MDSRTQARFLFVVGVVLTIVVAALVRKGERRRGLAMLAGWAVPGAGQAVLGRWRKGLFFFVLLSGTLVFGLWLVNFRPVSFDDNPFYFIGQFGSGLTFAAAKLFSAEKAVPRQDLHPSWFDPGLLYVCVAGLLNLVVMMNVLDVKPAAPPATPPPPPAETAAPPPPASETTPA